MHAYRDAIRRSSGAFVIYPETGSDPELLRQYHEILPGLGAFALRPIASGPAAAPPRPTFIVESWTTRRPGLPARTLPVLAGGGLQERSPRQDTAKVSGGFLPEQAAGGYPGAPGIRPHRRTVPLDSGNPPVQPARRRAQGQRRPTLRGVGSGTGGTLRPDLERTSLWRVTGYPQLLTRERMLNSDIPIPAAPLFLPPGGAADERTEWSAGSRSGWSISSQKRLPPSSGRVCSPPGSCRTGARFGSTRASSRGCSGSTPPWWACSSRPSTTRCGPRRFAGRWTLAWRQPPSRCWCTGKAPAWLVVVGTQAASQAVYPSPQGIREKGHGVPQTDPGAITASPGSLHAPARAPGDSSG